MVGAAISNLKRWKASANKFSPFIKRYLNTSIVSGKLVQTKDKGASGSLKLSANKVKNHKKKSGDDYDDEN